MARCTWPRLEQGLLRRLRRKQGLRYGAALLVSGAAPPPPAQTSAGAMSAAGGGKDAHLDWGAVRPTHPEGTKDASPAERGAAGAGRDVC